MEQTNKLKYDGEYLERYRKGQLASAEAHALEKASLEDPLLAEALEGFHQSNRSSEPELQFLKEWVNERVEENQAAIRFMPKSRSFAPLLQVAAVFLLLMGAAWMAYTFWVNPTQPAMADNRNNRPAPVQSAPLDESTRVLSNPSPPPSPSPSPVPMPPVQSTETKIPADQPQAMRSNEPVESVTVSDAVVSVEPVQSRNLPVSTVQPAEKDAARSEAKALKRQELSVEERPNPVGGWTNYESYLDRNREAAPTASNTNVNPVVVLSFEVGKDGRPQDIRVESSAGIFYDEKAMDLLKKGPGWLPGINGKRAELRVRF